ncbi:MAG: hypothetical protein A3H44_05170 [Gammaproteobacteria bacterium RIFCSPLOWO2_02_FULL_57_10]|nr:MAG: hypothetical protein A3H44_05170 [Gammaproteobacteria bacterium RIFCSPLOWO2_02_FULL_57_10]
MISEENNEELRPPEPHGSDEPDNDVTEAGVTRNDAPTGPGELLSRKREALGMTVQEVADELHITMHYVRALESNAHDKLPGDVFIRGYIRAYANLLKLDPVVLINVYNDFTNQQASAAEEASSSRSRRRRDRNLPWIVVSGIAFVGIAFALWYFNSRAPATPANSTQGATSPAPAQIVVPAPALNDGSTPTIDNVATTLAVEIVAPDADNVATPESTTVVPEAAAVEATLETTVAATNPAVTAPVPAGLMPVPTASVAQQLNDVRSSSTADTAVLPSEDVAAPLEVATTGAGELVPQPAAETRIISVDAGGEDLVQITFNGESMVQVEDSNDKQIYRDIRSSGDVLRITGSAPFNILLGDAAATELSLNGSNIDFTSNIRIDNSVRLTIGL